MNIVYPSHHRKHRPPAEIWNGTRQPHAEVPDRIEHILHAVSVLPQIKVTLPKRFPLSWIEAVHTPDYVRYISQAGRLAGKEYTYPSVFPFTENTVQNDIARRGFYTFDMYTPVNNSTYLVACASAMAALTAASLVRRGENFAYALCRPPGHHAERARMGGYCYFNNAAIAANYLSRRGKVVLLDIDVHHGNGSQHIFYERADVIVINIHADPTFKFPYFSGSQHERGTGKGSGYNFNFPLPLKTGDRPYDAVLSKALGLIRQSSPQFLVVSIGYDAHVDDPIGGLSLSTLYYRQIASQIRRIHIPTVLVQEGGYNTAKLGDVAKNFVSGFLDSD